MSDQAPPGVDPTLHQLSVDVARIATALSGFDGKSGLIHQLRDMARSQATQLAESRKGRSDVYAKIDGLEQRIDQELSSVRDLAVTAHTWARALSWFVGIAGTVGGGAAIARLFV